MNIQLDNNKDLFVQQRDWAICLLCNNKLWCAVDTYEDWAACIWCNIWFVFSNRKYEKYSKMNILSRKKLLMIEYEAGDYKKRIEIMTLILGQGE